MALNNCKRDRWFMCAIGNKEKGTHALTKGWGKSLRKRKAKLKELQEEITRNSLIIKA